MRKLGPADLGDLLELPLVAVLATYRMDGGVLLSPVWHQWRDGGFDVAVGPNDVKLKHLRRDPRASVVVYEHEPPYRGPRGARRGASRPGAAASTPLSSMAVRYLGPEGGPAYVESVSAADTVLVRLEPGRSAAGTSPTTWAELQRRRTPRASGGFPRRRARAQRDAPLPCRSGGTPRSGRRARAAGAGGRAARRRSRLPTCRRGTARRGRRRCRRRARRAASSCGNGRTVARYATVTSRSAVASSTGVSVGPTATTSGAPAEPVAEHVSQSPSTAGVVRLLAQPEVDAAVAAERLAEQPVDLVDVPGHVDRPAGQRRDERDVLGRLVRAPARAPRRTTRRC